MTAMVTPFGERGEVNEDAFVRLIHHLVENGSDGLVVTGTTGESPTLSDEEKQRLWALAVAESDDAFVVAGTGSNDTAHSIHLTERATEIGVDAVLVVAPYYNKPNRRGILAHYRAVAAATDRPVIVYNIPSRSVIDIPNDLLRELGEIPNVEAVKQARYEDAVPVEGVDLLAGNDNMLADVLDRGGTGGILVASHIVGREMHRMLEDADQRRAIDQSLQDVYEALTVTASPAPVKAALNMIGLDAGALRLPMVECTEEEAAVVREALERHNLLTAV
jgi:4-hydroxy-tetrahydrodipicolinate synthase